MIQIDILRNNQFKNKDFICGSIYFKGGGYGHRLVD